MALGREKRRSISTKFNSRMIVAAAAGGALALLPAIGRAADSTWTGQVDFNWNVDANWSNNAPGSAAGLSGTSTDTATFNTPGGGTGTEIIVDSGRNIGSIVWDIATGTNARTLGTTTGNTLYLTGGGSASVTATTAAGTSPAIGAPVVLLGNYSFINNSTTTTVGLKINTSITAAPNLGAINLTLGGTNYGGTLTSSDQIAANITDGTNTTLGLIKNDTGVWDIRAATGNTYSGDTVLNAGAIRFNSAGAFSPNSNYIVNQGATFRPSVSGTIKSLTVNSPTGYTDPGAVVRASITESGGAVTSINTTSGAGLKLDMSTATSAVDFGIPINLTGAVADTGGVQLVMANTTPKVSWSKPMDLGTVNRTFDIGHSTLNTTNGDPDLQFNGILSGAGGLTKSGPGVMKINNATINYTGPTSVTAGELKFSNNFMNSSSVSVGGTGVLTMQSDGTFQHVLKTSSVSATGGGRVNIADNKMILTAQSVGSWNGSAYTGVTGLIASGYGPNQDFSGSGIVTTQSNATGGNTLTNIGVASNSDLGLGSFGGQGVGANDTLVMYTYGGDANLDGVVNGDDYFQIDSAFPTNGHGWFNGDFNYDGVVNGDDYFVIDSNFPAQGTAIPTSDGIAGVTAVPEPASVGLFAAAAAGLFARRRRR